MRFLLTSSLLLACVVSCALANKNQKVPSRPVPYTQKAQARDGAGHGGGGHGGGGHGGGFGGGGGGGHGGASFGGGSSFSSSSHGGGPSSGGSYSAPAPKAPSYVEEPAKDTGFYYYYYPVVPERGGGGKKGGLFSSSKGFLGKMMETIMYPIMYPFMRMYDYFDGRALTARASDYLPMQLFEKIAMMVEEEIYKEECLSRMICQLGKSAEGYETFIHLSDFFVPEEYQEHLKTFKDSALKKSDCDLKYKCQSLNAEHKL